jgi:Zn-dependent protease
MIFLLMGGIGLPGGAVYIEKWRLKSRGWETAVALAGPFANALLALILSLILRFAPISIAGIWPGIAFLAFLQITALVLNLIPLPPFDGFGAIEPYLPINIRTKLAQTQGMLSWVVIILLWQVPFVGNIFWELIFYLTQLTGLPLKLIGLGSSQFKFW